MKIGTSILEHIGNTPLLALQQLDKPYHPVRIYVKAEWLNPGRSVKDRPALRMIEEGEKSGELTKDKVLLDASSGNTAIAYAMIAAVKGYRVELVMPANVSEERKVILRNFNAKVYYSDALEGSDGAIMQARKIYESDPERYFMPDQYNNLANPLAHQETTAKEIWEQTHGEITHFVATLGTSGTAVGAGRGLKAFNKDIKIIAVEPAGSLHGLEGMKHIPTSIRPSIYDESVIDEKFSIETEDAYEWVKRLAVEEGLLVGQSSGAAIWGAIQVAKQIKSGCIVTVFPDGGRKYLSTRVWE